MNLTRRSLLGATAAAAIVGTVGCSAKPGDNAQPGGEAGDTIKLGLNYELSGPVATYGQASVLGINMAIAQINEAGGIDGKQIKLFEYDNKSDAAEATTLANKLMTQDGVIA
ncbi:MAG TPA: ABC transporter substrate-binding protein, partial [Arachnia sp.]|nr:ABC transporter substrate-binding protein [Arachnia sp.]